MRNLELSLETERPGGMTSLLSLAQIFELLSGGDDISVRRNNIEKNFDVFFDSLALLAWVVYLRSGTNLISRMPLVSRVLF